MSTLFLAQAAHLTWPPPDSIFRQTNICEKEPDRAWQTNAEGTRTLCRSFAELLTQPVTAAIETPRPLFVYISTDWVYDGHLPSPADTWKETASAQGFGVYGRSKAAAEQAVRELLPLHHVVLRPALIYGPPAPFDPQRLRSCLGWMIDSLRSGDKPLTLFTDEYRTPVLVHDVVQAVLRCIAVGTKSDNSGLAARHRTLNIGGATVVNRLDLGRFLAQALGKAAEAEPLLIGEFWMFGHECQL